MMFPDATEVERLRYRQGQRLRSCDFRDQVALDAQRRWWHNRALHNAYGIATGLDPVLTTEADGATAHIGSGVAYDCFGRELVLLREWAVRVPDRDVSLTLVLRYRDRDARGNDRHDPLDVALAVADVAELAWQETARLTFRDGVAVCQKPHVTRVKLSLSLKMRQLVAASGAKVAYEDGALVVVGVMSKDSLDALLGEPATGGEGTMPAEVLAYRAAVRDLFERSQVEYGRSSSRRLVRPRMATGATIAGSTPWTAWLPENGLIAGVQVKVDTSMGGFTDVPCYFASLQGMPAVPLPIFEHTSEVSTNGFVFRFWMPFTGRRVLVQDNRATDLLALAANLKLFVRWWAVQPAAGATGLAR